MKKAKIEKSKRAPLIDYRLLFETTAILIFLAGVF